MAWLLAGSRGIAHAQDAVIDVLVADAGNVYADLSAALLRDTAGAPIKLQFNTVERVENNGPPPVAVLALGTRAVRQAGQRAEQSAFWARVPVLAALLPQSAYRAVAAALPRGSSAVWLDQPVERYLELLRQAFPNRRKVGVLLGPGSAAMESALARAASVRGLELVKGMVYTPSEDLYPALREVLQSADVLLALPEPQLYGGDTLQNILIASYRQRVPMLSYSAAHVRAGATLALFTPIEQVSLQVALALRALQSGRGLPAPELSQGFGVAVNDQVARSLSLNLRSAGELEAAVRRMESRS